MFQKTSLALGVAGLLLTQNLIMAQGESPIGNLSFDGKGTAFPSGLSSVSLRARLLASNEVPSIDGAPASGRANISVIRGGTEADPINFIEFQVDYLFTVPATITGMHIHSGTAGTNGPIVVDSGLPGGPITVQANRQGTIHAIVRDSQWAQEIQKNPSAFYVNLHTTANPGGVMRGQLTAAQQLIAGADMRTGNEVPGVPQDGIAAGFVVATITRDSNNRIDSAEVRFLVRYQFPRVQILGPQNITGLHIHSGAAGTNGPVILDSGINASTGLVVNDTGSGDIDVRNEIDVTDPVKVRALEALSESFGAYYMNIHTNGFPAGFARGQVSPTTRVIIGATLARTGSDLAGDASYIADVLRDSRGFILSGLSTFAVLHRNFPAGTKFTGLHIHEGDVNTAGGPIRIPSGLLSAAGDGAPGFIGTTTVFSDAVTASAVQDMVANIAAQGYYMNLHTDVFPAGAIRGQMGGGGFSSSGQLASITDAVSAISLDPPLRAVAPGGRVAIYGDFLVGPGTAGADQAGTSYPDALNGVWVEIDGVRAPIMFVGRNQINAIVPLSTQPGTRKLVVKLVYGAISSNEFPLTVQPYAPGIFITEGGAELLLDQGRGLVRPDNPARAGDRILVLTTGLGQTSPRLFDGFPAPDETQGLAVTDTVTATLGGVTARVVSSNALPGYAGKYVVTVEVPAGAAEGDQALELRIGGVASNRVSVSITK